MTHDLTLPRARHEDEPKGLAERAVLDPHRPRFHFTAPGGWLNDPNGLTHWGGVYHLFYQYNPLAAAHHRIHWGHATSRDLVTWTDEPVALIPGAEGPDRDGCWSGVLVDDGGTPTLVYSGRHGERELPCVATGSPDLRSWRKDPANPVIAAPPAGDLTAFRDHCVWRENGVWRHLVGSGVRGAGGTAFLYESDDLREWRYVGPLLTGDASSGTAADLDWTGTMWECVDLFRLDGTDILAFSAWDEGTTHHPLYWTGAYEGDTFVPRELHRLDYGQRYFYAPQSTRDALGRRIMFGWLQEGRDEDATAEAGWCGVMSLPRVVTLGGDGSLVQTPVPELARLRRDAVRTGPFTVTDGTHVLLDRVRGDQLDIEATLRLAPGAAARLLVRESDDGSERTVIEVARAHDGTGTLRLHREASSLDPSVDSDPRYGELPLNDDGVVELRVLVDHSALEVFANGRALAARVYPSLPDALGVGVTAVGQVAVERLDAWQMAAVFDAARPLWP